MSYLGVPPFGQTVRTVTELVATAGQTDFYPAGGYLPGYIDVTLNGVALMSSDYVASDGVKLTLTQAAAVSDELKTVAYWPVSLTDTYRKGEVDGFAVKLTGDQTIAGVKALNGGFYNGAQTIITSATTLSNTNLGGFVELSSNSFTLTLPNPALCNGGGLTIWNNGPACTLAAPSGNFYGPFGNSAATIPIPNQVTYNLRSDGYNWIIVNSQSVGANSASSAPPVYGARAWVNFNGTGTVAIRASGNVSSITDNGVGNYTVNFTNAMTDSNYSFAIAVQRTASGAQADQNIISTINDGAGNIASSSLRVRAYASPGNTSFDVDVFAVAIFR